MYLQRQVGIQLALPIQFPTGWIFSFWGSSCNFVGCKGRWMVPYNKFALYVRNQYEGCAVSIVYKCYQGLQTTMTKNYPYKLRHIMFNHVWFPNKQKIPPLNFFCNCCWVGIKLLARLKLLTCRLIRGFLASSLDLLNFQLMLSG